MELRLEIAEQLVLEIIVFCDQFGEVDVLFDDCNEKAACHVIGRTFISLMFHNGVDPGLQHGSENSQIVTAFTDLFDVATEDEKGRESDLFRQFSESVVVDDLRAETREEAFALARVAHLEIFPYNGR